jgi:DNA polymerase
VSEATERREALVEVYREASGCTLCPLAETRTKVVFGAGNADADLMFIGEAPGAEEDRRGLPFVGRAGGLLNELLGEIGLDRDSVFIANTLMCRPPGNRDPQPGELEACRPYLLEKVRLIEPKVIVTLGGRRVLLYPIYHPAAALYTPRMLDVLKDDFARLPELMGRKVAPPAPVYVAPVAAEPAVQLGLF